MQARLLPGTPVFDFLHCLESIAGTNNPDIPHTIQESGNAYPRRQQTLATAESMAMVFGKAGIVWMTVSCRRKAMEWRR